MWTNEASKSLPAPRARTIQFLLLTGAAAAATYGWSALNPLQEALRAALSLTDGQVALLQGPALALPIVIGGIPLGLLIDRVLRVRLLLLFALLNLAGGLLTAVAPDFVWLFVSRSVVGIAVPGINATIFSLIADLYPASQRGRAHMVVGFGQYAGMSAAFALGGMLLGTSNAPTQDWRRPMLWLNVPLLIIALAMFALREPARTEVAIARPSSRESFAELWRYRTVIAPLIVGLALSGMAGFGGRTWAVSALSRSFNLAPKRTGVIMAVAVFVGGVLGPIAGGLLADLCHSSGGPRRTILALSWLALLAIPTGCFALTSDVSTASVLLVIFLTIAGAILVIGGTLLTIVIPNELRGVCISITGAAQILLGVGLAPIAISLLSDALGGPAMIGKGLAWLTVVVSLFGAALFGLGARSIRPIAPA